MINIQFDLVPGGALVKAISSITPIPTITPTPSPTPNNTPYIFPTMPPGDVILFRSECIENDEIKVSFEILEPWLTSRKISSFWDELTKTERRSIIKKASNNPKYQFMDRMGEGKDNCEETNPIWGDRPVCRNLATAQNMRFGVPVPYSKKYYFENNKYPGVQCYCDENHYGLPTYYVTIMYLEKGSGWQGSATYCHAVTGIRVGDSIESLDDIYMFLWCATAGYVTSEVKYSESEHHDTLLRVCELQQLPKLDSIVRTVTRDFKF